MPVLKALKSKRVIKPAVPKKPTPQIHGGHLKFVALTAAVLALVIVLQNPTILPFYHKDAPATVDMTAFDHAANTAATSYASALDQSASSTDAALNTQNNNGEVLGASTVASSSTIDLPAGSEPPQIYDIRGPENQ